MTVPLFTGAGGRRPGKRSREAFAVSGINVPGNETGKVDRRALAQLVAPENETP